MNIVFIIAGAILGGMLLEEEGIIPGMLLGYLVYQNQEGRKKLKALGERVDLLQERLRRLVAPETAPATPPPGQAESTVEPEPVIPVAPIDKEQAPPDVTPPIADRVRRAPVEEPAFKDPEPAKPLAPPKPDVIQEWVTKIRDVVLGGNTIARLGVAILFVGLSFLVKLAIENSLFPIELRLAGAGLLGTGMIGFGWKFAQTRKGYGVSLQGGGIAILFLTVFASFRLYELLPSEAAFIILIVITILGSAIAILQNSQALAVLSMLGGFLAPVITSTGDGSHIALFTYYAVLNAGILAIAWYKPWRMLNLTGFFSTFGIATLWGAGDYIADFFATTEPFLILFFLMYMGIALLYALRHNTAFNRMVDGTLVFGLPVWVFSIQAVLVDPYEYGLAWSALGFGGFYAVVAWFLSQRYPEKLRMMVQSFSGIGLALISMTIPFALNATWTGAGWALEGAALVWLGIRQQRMLVRAGGVLLLILASASFLIGIDNTTHTMLAEFKPLMNPLYMGFFCLSLASLFAAFQLHHHRDKLPKWEPYIGIVLMIAGVAWWLIGGFMEIEREVANDYRMTVATTFAALSALGIAFGGARLSWNAFVRTALFLIPTLFLLLIANSIFSHPFADYGILAWAIAIPVVYVVLRLLEDRLEGRLLGFFHALSLWLVTLLGVVEGYWALETYVFKDASLIWPRIGFFMAPLAAIFIVVWLDARKRWPLAPHRNAYLKFGLLPILGSLWLASMAFSFDSTADPSPLPYIPFLNPLDILLGISTFAGLSWYRSVQTGQSAFLNETLVRVLKWGMLATAFIWLNATIGRTVHHWAGVPYNDNMFDSSTFQAALSVCWTLLAVTTMAFAARREARTPWLVAATLLGVVVIKLFVIDLSSLQTLHQVISFIVVGLLLLLIGYVAPVPPKKTADLEASNEVS